MLELGTYFLHMATSKKSFPQNFATSAHFFPKDPIFYHLHLPLFSDQPATEKSRIF